MLRGSAKELEMSVKVKLSAIFQNATGGLKTAECSGETVGECLKQLSDRYPLMKKMFFDEGDKLSGYLAVSVNGKSLQGDLNTVPVKSGDEIYPMILIEGG